MKFGTYHTFQCPPWMTPAQVFDQELERVRISESLGFDSVWVPEQHFFPYCICGDALLMATHVAGITQRVTIGVGIANLTFTHPLRFMERVAMLDHIAKGRAIVAVGRGYQVPQMPVFGVDPSTTREIFDEALDVALKAWTPEPFSHTGKRFSFPEIQLWPTPLRSPYEILRHAVASPDSRDACIRRGLAPLVSRTFELLAEEKDWYDAFRVRLNDLGGDARLLDDAISMRYGFVAPTRTEAREIARRPWEWDFAMLQKLTQVDGKQYITRESGWPEVYQYDEWAENRFIFDDPKGCIEKVAMLRDAGVKHLVLWMGIGGVDHDHVVRSMRLFAEDVIPKFRKK